MVDDRSDRVEGEAVWVVVLVLITTEEKKYGYKKEDESDAC